MDRERDKAKIFELVTKYYNDYHIQSEYQDGDRIAYASRVFDEKEMINLIDSSLDFWLTSGDYTDKFEQELAQFLNIKYCSLVNSGSSANLLAFMALTSPLLKERAILRGDEVITVAAGFPTTVSPIIQYGAVPVFVDVTIPQYNIDVSRLEDAVSKKTKAVMIAHTLGNPFDLKAVKDFCDKHNLWLIEDNCDALGSKYYIDGSWKFTGTIGDIGTSSFYPPHHMTMGEGGATYTDNALLNKIMRSMRDWGRDCVCPPGVDNLCKHRFEKQYGQLPKSYDHKYVYSHFGYNLKATDMQAAIGCAQLKKLSGFGESRVKNFNYLYNGLKGTEGLILPEPCANASPSWFGFMLTVKKPYLRETVVSLLESNDIQTRALFAGNIIKHPCFDAIRDTNTYRICGDLHNTNSITEDTFWVGVYPKMTSKMLDKIIKIIKAGMKDEN